MTTSRTPDTSPNHGSDGDQVIDVSQFYDRPKSATEALNRSVRR